MLKYISWVEHHDDVINIKKYQTDKWYWSKELINSLKNNIRVAEGSYRVELQCELGEVKKLVGLFHKQCKKV